MITPEQAIHNNAGYALPTATPAAPSTPATVIPSSTPSPVTPAAPPTASSATNPYWLQPGETIDAYNARIPKTGGATPSQPPPATKTPSQGTNPNKIITAPNGQQYVITPTGDIAEGPTSGQYQVGSNVSQYPDLKDAYDASISGKSLDEVRLQNQQTADRAEADRVHNLLNGYQTGTIPLTAGEQAQVDGLRASFQHLIDAQTLVNTGAYGSASISGYQGGAQYGGAGRDHLFGTNVIGSVLSAGLQKISDLNLSMASAVATLTQGFKDNDIKAVQAAWDQYSGYADKRREELKKNIDDANALIQKQQDAATKATKDAQDRQDAVTKDINDVALKAAENGLTDKNILSKIKGANTVQEAIDASSGWLQSATGTLGDYLQYKRDSEAKGLPAEDYTAFKAETDKRAANAEVSKAYATARASALGKASVDGGGAAADPAKVEGWVQAIRNQTAKLSDIPSSDSALRDAVVVSMAGGGPGSTPQSTLLASTYDALKNLGDRVNNDAPWNNTGFSGAVGMKGPSSLFGILDKPIAGSPASDFDAQLDRAVNGSILPNLSVLKGMGRITDREFKALSDSVTSLKASTSEDAFKTELQRLINDVKGKMAQADKELPAGAKFQQDADRATTAIAKFQVASSDNKAKVDALYKIAPKATPTEIASQLGLSNQ